MSVVCIVIIFWLCHLFISFRFSVVWLGGYIRYVIHGIMGRSWCHLLVWLYSCFRFSVVLHCDESVSAHIFVYVTSTVWSSWLRSESGVLDCCSADSLFIWHFWYMLADHIDRNKVGCVVKTHKLGGGVQG